MSDKELNIAIYWEVNDDSKIPYGHDFVNDPAWCVAMMEKHRLGLDYQAVEWAVGYAEDPENPGFYLTARDESLTHAVALAVLELTRRKQA